MRFSVLLLPSIFSITLARPKPGHPFGLDEVPAWLKNHEWTPASKIEGASRSPCPILNTLANHGFLPRNGKNITAEQFNTAQVVSLNMEPAFAAEITKTMFGKLGVNSTDGSPPTLNLDHFNDHGVVEHDASLTRLDILQGDTSTVQPDLVQKLLDDTVPQSASFIDASSLARSRLRRDKESVAAGSPPLSKNDKDTCTFEAALFLLLMGQSASDGSSWNAKKDVVKDLLINERFPVDLGYVRSDKALSSERMGPLVNEIKKTYMPS